MTDAASRPYAAPGSGQRPERPASARWVVRFLRWARRVDLERRLALGLAVLAIASGVGTAIVLTGAGPLGPEPDIVLAAVYLHIVRSEEHTSAPPSLLRN